jgi:hypothetical protein
LRHQAVLRRLPIAIGTYIASTPTLRQMRLQRHYATGCHFFAAMTERLQLSHAETEIRPISAVAGREEMTRSNIAY